MQRHFNGQGIAFSINGARAIRHPFTHTHKHTHDLDLNFTLNTNLIHIIDV